MQKTMSAERERVDGFGRLEDGLRQAGDWYLWGPYVSERQWGTVREDYSADGEAWNYLPHDHARSRAYRWGEDGLAGFCDVEQRLCLGLALWNGRDPILKERPFGLTGAEANHGEDVKEYWWYLDAVPSHAWNRWRYHYPQAAFPYEDLRAENGRRGKHDPEYELLDTGVFDDDRYWIIEVSVREGRSDRRADDRAGHQRRPGGRHAARAADRVVPQHLVLGRRRPQAGPGRSGRRGVGHRRAPVPRRTRTARRPGTGRHRTGRCCSARTRPTLGAAVRHRPDHPVPQGRHQRPRHQRRGHRQSRPAGHQVRLLVPGDGRAGRDRRAAAAAAPAGAGREAPRPRSAATSSGSSPQRRAEADEFYAELTPAGASRGRGDGDAAGVRRDAVEQAALLLRRGPLARRRPGPAAAAAGPARTGATPDGATSTPSTSCRCRTSGSTPGSPPGTWPSTA